MKQFHLHARVMFESFLSNKIGINTILSLKSHLKTLSTLDPIKFRYITLTRMYSVYVICSRYIYIEVTVYNITGISFERGRKMYGLRKIIVVYKHIKFQHLEHIIPIAVRMNIITTES